MRPRFLIDDLDPSQGIATLGGGEAHHLSRVLRLGPGDEVAVFDGRGREFRATVDSVAGSTIRVRLGDAIDSRPERRVPITLAQAVLKGSSMDDAVRDATMMGATAIRPLVTAHTVARRASAEHGADRWRRVAIASAKQCGRARIPEVHDPEPFDAWRRRDSAGATIFLVEPTITATTLRDVSPFPIRALASQPAPARATLAVGPEGGWSAEEVRAALDAGFAPITLGPLTLRAEAVPLAALAALTVIWD